MEDGVAGRGEGVAVEGRGEEGCKALTWKSIEIISVSNNAKEMNK